MGALTTARPRTRCRSSRRARRTWPRPSTSRGRDRRSRTSRTPRAAGVRVRIYEPEDARGTIAYLHGGGWVLGNLESVDAVCRALANEAGARVVSIDYRLAPEHPFPAALDDALSADRARRGRRRRRRQRRRQPRRGRRPPASRTQLKLQLLIYPVTDAGVDTPSYREFDERFGLTAAAMRRFWNLYLDGADGLRPGRVAAARDGPRAASPPAYILTAEPRRPARRGRGLRGRARARRRAGHAQPRRGRDPRLLALADDGDRPRARSARRAPRSALR